MGNSKHSHTTRQLPPDHARTGGTPRPIWIASPQQPPPARPRSMPPPARRKGMSARDLGQLLGVTVGLTLIVGMAVETVSMTHGAASPPASPSPSAPAILPPTRRVPFDTRTSDMVPGDFIPVPRSPAAPAPPVTPVATTSPADVEVWVNTATGVYHFKGERWWAATAHGEFMSQAEAERQGYRMNHGN